MSGDEPVEGSLSGGDPAECEITDRLSQASGRSPDFASENRALAGLARAMSEDPRRLPQRLVELALELCRAGSAGISILRFGPEGEYFEWTAVAGALASHPSGRVPRGQSTSGLTLSKNATQLFDRPGRFYPFLDIPSAPIQESLIVPLHSAEGPLGTVWAVHHEAGSAFDREDARILESLGAFIGAAMRLLTSLDSATSSVRELKRAQEELEESDRRKNEFLAMLGHELRNPLGAMASSVQILRSGPQDDRSSWATEVLDRQLDHVTHMIDDLLDISRITHGRIEIERIPVSLAAVVAQAVETTRPQIASRRQEVEVDLPEGPLPVIGDPERLAQIVSNLLDNASKYSSEGGRIFVTGERTESELLIRVRDSGVGITKEMLPRIFDLFVQGARTLDRAQGGLGIGLALVRRLAAMHGGTVEAQSAGAGQGSEFLLRLPAPADGTEVAPATDAASVRPKDDARARRRILVVDDNEDAAAGLSLLLELDGHDVRAAHDGAAALRVSEEFAPDIVILDIGLPGMDGYEVARRLRARPDGSHTTIIALTGYGLEEDRRRSFAAGFDHHVVKPIRSSEELLGPFAGERPDPMSETQRRRRPRTARVPARPEPS